MADDHAGRARKATGPDRPTYFEAADVDRVMAIVLALTSELASLRERLDTHERLAALGVVATPDAIDAYVPEDDVEGARESWRDAYIRRLYRVVTEDLEALKAD